jgi:hypothetical protein
MIRGDKPPENQRQCTGHAKWSEAATVHIATLQSSKLRKQEEGEGK